MWTCENRPKYNRDKLHYPSDLTDEKWSHIAPLISPAKHGGRSTGCRWRYVPKDLPPPPAIPLGFAKRNLWPASPKSTLFDYFDFWNYDSTLENIQLFATQKLHQPFGSMGPSTFPQNCVLLHLVTLAKSGPELLSLEERQLVGHVG